MHFRNKTRRRAQPVRGQIQAFFFFALFIISCAGGSEKSAATKTRTLEKIGVQLYTLRAETKKDFEGTLRKVADLGYDQVEFAGYFGKSPAEMKNLLQQLNLEAAATHVPYGDLKKDPEKLCRETSEYGIRHMVIAWVPPLERMTQKQYKNLARQFNRAGELCQKYGVQFVYHNHDFEFKGKAFETPFDILMNETDSALVKFELDLFWISKAGKEALAYLKKYPGRFSHFHVKDMDKKGNMVDVGSGEIDFSAMIALGKEGGVEFFIVEHDNPENSFQSVENSLNHLRKMAY